MTCIVGIVKGNKVIIGGDRQGTDGWLGKVNRVDKKVFRKGEFIFGFTTSYRMGQLIQYKLVIPPLKEKQDIMEYMVAVFAESIRSVLKDGGFMEVNKSVESGGTFLIGFRGRLFKIESDFQVGEPFNGFYSCGCGQDLALGAMQTAIDLGIENPNRILHLGLVAAHCFSAGVGSEFDFVEIGGEDLRKDSNDEAD